MKLTFLTNGTLQTHISMDDLWYVLIMDLNLINLNQYGSNGMILQLIIIIV